MVLAVNCLEAVAVHVRVMLGRSDVGMTEQFLDGSQISTARQEMRRETMSQGVGADFGIESCSLDIFLN